MVWELGGKAVAASLSPGCKCSFRHGADKTESPHQIKPQRMSGKVGEALLQRERNEACGAEGQALRPGSLCLVGRQ